MGEGFQVRRLHSQAKESEHQKEIARYLRWREDKPLFTAPCNGMETSAAVKRKAKEMGLERGVPDLLVFEPRPPYCGLAIELKRGNGSRPTNEQVDWIQKLRVRGWQASVEYGSAAALRRIRHYLDSAPRPRFPFVADTHEYLEDMSE